MSIIGGNTVGGNYTIEAGRVYIHGLSAQHLSVGAIAQEGSKVFVRHGIGGSNAGNSVEIGIYDVSGGADGAALVSTITTVTGTNAPATWEEVTLSGLDLTSLETGKSYAVGLFSSTGWGGAVTGGAWTANNMPRMNGQSQLPLIFNINTDSYAYPVAFYVETQDAVAGVIQVSSVNSGNSIAQGDLVPVDGDNFALTGNVVTISPSEDINDSGAVTSVVSGEGSTSTFNINVNLPAGSNDQDPVHLFVDNGTDTTSGLSVSVSALALYPVTVDLDTACQSSDFASGVIVIKNAGLPNEDVAINLSAITQVTTQQNDSAPNAILYEAHFSSGRPLKNVDTLRWKYNELEGDIATTGASRKALRSVTIDSLPANICTF